MNSAAKSGIKVKFEISEGEQVERILPVYWPTVMFQNLKTLNGAAAAEELKRVIAKSIVERLTPELVFDMLTELEKKTP